MFQVFTLTATEMAILEEIQSKQIGAKELSDRHYRNQNYSSPEYQQETVDWNALNARIKELRDSPEFLSLSLKNQLNGVIAGMVPGGDPGILLSLCEQAVTVLDSPEALRAAALAKDLVLRGLTLAADKDLADASANLVVVRYRALLRAGIPAEIAGQIIVAEAASGSSYGSHLNNIKNNLPTLRK